MSRSGGRARRATQRLLLSLAGMKNHVESKAQVIISGKSSPQVLTNDGIVNYARAIGLYPNFYSLESFSPLMSSQLRRMPRHTYRRAAIRKSWGRTRLGESDGGYMRVTRVGN